MNVRPLHDRILVKPVEEKETIKGGIIIPDSAKEKPVEGEVVAVGSGKRNEKGDRIPLDVKVGDHVLWSKYAGRELPMKIGDVDYIILEEHEILGVIEKGKTASGGKK
jgi:chaperonin GroES